MPAGGFEGYLHDPAVRLIPLIKVSSRFVRKYVIRISTSLSAELDIAIKESMRGSGVGTKLIKTAEIWAGKHGADRLILKTYVGNERAINFYTKHNHFEVIGLVLAKPLKRAKHTK